MLKPVSREAPTQPPSGEPVDWKGTPRYQVVRRIGRGGMGVVYEAHDCERAQPVALKTLLRFDPGALYLFKQEFRTLADVHHPNLVRLYELVATEGDQAFFAMELVQGTDFLTFVQGRASLTIDDPNASANLPTLAVRCSSVPAGARQSTAPSATSNAVCRQQCRADLDRLRAALRQLVEGIQALHAAGKLHRDIKPSNVLVANDGRVVVLDFGVATELRRPADAGPEDRGVIVGTARYMAPEQAFDAEPTVASDWYSVGAVLFEALVGGSPFSGSSQQIIGSKILLDAPAPSECVDGVPEDLDALCRALLDREPARRPLGAEILRRIGASVAALTGRPPAATAGASLQLVGREAHLLALREAFEAARAGKSITVRVRGRSGMGKSALLQHFLDGLSERGEALVLRGRAYERETVPYKAVDSVVDALSRHLMYLSDQEGTLALPQGIWALARLFPVLRRVPGISGAVAEPISDPNRVRRRGFTALRELLEMLARRRPLVLFVDDAQWGDTDSAVLLAELVRSFDVAPILLVLAHREENSDAAAFLAELRSRWPSGAKVREVVVGPLETEEARRLSLALLGDESPTAHKMAWAVARESSGSPFLVEELSRCATDRLLAESDTRITLEEMVAERLDSLPEEARRLVEIVAIGGRPLPASWVADASEIRSSENVIALLSSRRFLRPGLRDGREVVETVHDRIRETIVAQLPATVVRSHHRALARVLEATPGADPEAAAVHLFGAGEIERGATFAERAAEAAASQLAFDQAARLFRLVIDQQPADTPSHGRLCARMAELLGWAGRNEEAGRAYVRAAEKATGAARAALERAAAAQLIAAGRIDEGGMMLRRVLAGAGVRVPTSPMAITLSFLAYKTRLRLGMQFTERASADVPATERERIDALHVAALGLASVDALLATSMQARQLVEALRAGDRARVVRAATMYYGSHLAQRGGPVDAHEREVRSLIERLVEKGGSAEEAAFSRGMHGVGLVLRGKWREAVQVIDAAYANVSNQQASTQPQIALYAVYAHAFLGDLIELRRRQERLLAVADERGDLFMSVLLNVSHPVVLRLAADDPDGARVQVREAKARWAQGKYLIQDWQVMRSEAEVELYAGDAAKAYARIEQDARGLKESRLLRVQFIRGLTAFARGRAAVASVEASPGKGRARLAEARRVARQLERENMTWTAPLAAIVTAAEANARKDTAAAIGSLRSAIERAQAADMSLYAAAARHQLGIRLGGVEGRALTQHAEDSMQSQEIRAPARFAGMLVPGRWR
jgi:eukaryotic-like serine/threonine-protein kinase